MVELTTVGKRTTRASKGKENVNPNVNPKDAVKVTHSMTVCKKAAKRKVSDVEELNNAYNERGKTICQLKEKHEVLKRKLSAKNQEYVELQQALEELEEDQKRQMKDIDAQINKLEKELAQKGRENKSLESIVHAKPQNKI
ncbi:unnamed protein product [Cylindrotheca closterium]|uniref:Coiled-coil domain-containing protein 153 n=1 Tax=Cylindrotheca closterium TaxID=2856 RepID=A0AAD2FP32_9STRA|nr:unnamed protein product [Cylindrotheca closterium]